MPADSVIDPGTAHVVRLRTIELPRRETKPVQVPRFSKWRRAKRVQGTFALAELGRETGARC